MAYDACWKWPPFPLYAVSIPIQAVVSWKCIVEIYVQVVIMVFIWISFLMLQWFLKIKRTILFSTFHFLWASIRVFGISTPKECTPKSGLPAIKLACMRVNNQAATQHGHGEKGSRNIAKSVEQSRVCSPPANGLLDSPHHILHIACRVSQVLEHLPYPDGY